MSKIIVGWDCMVTYGMDNELNSDQPIEQSSKVRMLPDNMD